MRKLSILLLLLSSLASAAAPQTQLKWDGHAAFEITTPKGLVLIIDPWLSNPLNPAGANGKNPLDAIKKADFILITHGHADHVGESVALAKKTGAKLVTNIELGTNMGKLLGFPAQQMNFETLGNIGGEITVGDGEVVIAMVPAVHSSGLQVPGAGEKEPDFVYGGNPMGFVIKIQNGPTFYHSGDTDYFGDMQLIGERYSPDVALLNIGGHFGMSPEMAARAAKAVHAKLAIPHHFKTFPVLTQDPAPFITALAKLKIASRVMNPGETLVFDGKLLKK